MTDSQPLLSVAAHIDRWAEKQPDKDFLIVPHRNLRITWADVQDEVRRFSRRLDTLGIKPGEPVSLMMANSRCSVLAILGTLYGGRVIAPVNLVAGVHQIAYMLDHSETQIVFVSHDEEGRLRAAAEMVSRKLRIIVCDIDDGPSWPDAVGDGVGNPAPATDPVCDGLLMYTSGTTGQPKGAVLSQKAILAGGRNAIVAHHLSGADRTLLILPLYHINGFCVSLMSTLVSGASIVVPHRFSATRFWHHVLDFNCTWFSCVPTQIQYLLKTVEDEGPPDRDRLKTVRFARSASAPLSPEVQKRFEDLTGLIIIETMGLTECAAQILSNPMPPGTRKFGSPGIAFANAVKVIAEDGNDVPAGTPGEIIVRGDNVFQRYLKNEDATAEAFTSDGWFRTGDLGYMDDDGYVFVTGRMKELIIKGGENIAPREIDEALLDHAAVVEAAAFARPCERYGQRVEAAVVLVARKGVSEAELIAYCRDRIGLFKAPDRVHIVDDLPRGPSGKVQRLKLADTLAA